MIRPPAPRRRRRVIVAAAAVLLAATDTYVVVVALPSIMGSVGLGVDQLQRATPIITGFLLGYVAILPLLGRLADLYGRPPVLVACLVSFGLGSLITATAQSLGVVVAGRALQGLGGGGLVPVTLSLVADRWSAERRALPLGVIGGLQELGSVLGPLYGAGIVAMSGWRTIFWINLPAVILLGAAFGPAEPSGEARPAVVGRRDVPGIALVVAAAGCAVLALWSPPRLADDATFGQLYVPLVAGPTWSAFTTPLAFAAVGLLVSFALWELLAPGDVRRLVPLRRLAEVVSAVDAGGALLLAAFLACIVVVFSTADPSRAVVASSAPVLGPVAVVLAAGFWWHQRRRADPLVPFEALRPKAAYGSLLINLAGGAALMAGLVDVPIFARLTRYPSSQVGAALVLLRLLAAIPVGAVAGGVLCRRWPTRAVATIGMGLGVAGFAGMAVWGAGALDQRLSVAGLSLPLHASDLELVVCGLGFGLVIAPVNASLLEAVRSELHGLAAALVVVARMVGMLVGLSVLTAVGLHQFYRAQAAVASPLVLCPRHPGSCAPYNRAVLHAALSELHAIFLGAAVSAFIAAVLAAFLLPGHSARIRGTAAVVLGDATLSERRAGRY